MVPPSLAGCVGMRGKSTLKEKLRRREGGGRGEALIRMSRSHGWNLYWIRSFWKRGERGLGTRKQSERELGERETNDRKTERKKLFEVQASTSFIDLKKGSTRLELYLSTTSLSRN